MDAEKLIEKLSQEQNESSKVVRIALAYAEFIELVKEMREAQKVYSEQFPTGFGCYAPIELEEKVDEYLKKMEK